MNNRGWTSGSGIHARPGVCRQLARSQEKIGLIFAAATDHDEYLGGGLYFDTGLGDTGTRGNALLFRSHSAPNEAPVNLDDEYTRERLTFRVSKPFQQHSELSLSGSVGFEADDLTSIAWARSSGTTGCASWKARCARAGTWEEPSCRRTCNCARAWTRSAAVSMQPILSTTLAALIFS